MKKLKFIKLFEQFSSSEYDRILDIYNEYGEEGMSKEEKEYLKSGGQTKIPDYVKDWGRSLIKIINKYGSSSDKMINMNEVIALPINNFFEYVYTIAPNGNKEELEKVKPIVSAYIDASNERYRSFNFMDNLQKLNKHFKVDNSFRW